MSDINIECPHCRKSFPLNKALAEPMMEAERGKLRAEAEQHIARERTQIEATAKAAAEAGFAGERKATAAALAQRDTQVEAAKKAELAALKAKESAEQAQRDVALEVQRQVDARRTEIEQQAAKQADANVATQMQTVRAQLATKDEKLKAAQLAEADALRLKAEAEEAKREAERHLARERTQIEAAARAGAEAQIAEERQATATAFAERDTQIEVAKKAELAALKAKESAEQAQRDVALEVQRQVDARRAEIEQQAANQANADTATQMRAVQAQLAAKDEKLKAAQQAEIDALRLKAEAEDAKREVELDVTRRLDQERGQVREAAIKERDEANRLKAAEKDKQLDDLREQIEELRRKGNTGSQQLAGEVLELDLMEVLQHAFPNDHFERVTKGQSGADVIQTVLSPSGGRCGSILWESKRTKTWQNAWLSKLREDQRAAKADIAALATETLPAGVITFAEMERVWVTSLPTIVPVAAALRHGLIEVGTVRRAGTLAESSKDQVFEYLMSAPFRQRLSRIVEGYEELRTDLEREKKSMNSLWSKREKQLERVLGGVSGLYGDLQGIVGSSLPTLDKLELPSLEQDDERPRLSVVGSDIDPANLV